MLSCRGLGKKYGSQWVLKNLTFELDRGDSLIVTGLNGSGKSTFLKVLAGLQRPSEGEMVFTNPQLKIGLSALDLAVYPFLTPLEHLEWSGQLRGCPSRADELLDRVGLTQASGRSCNKLSTGMRNRLKLAMAIQHQPDLLLLDEPGASLDESGRDLVNKVVAEQRERGTVIIATNDPNERRLGNLELQL